MFKLQYNIQYQIIMLINVVIQFGRNIYTLISIDIIVAFLLRVLRYAWKVW